MVKATNQNKVYFDTDETGKTPKFVLIPEATTLNRSEDATVEEYDTLDSPRTKRVMTGGIKTDLSFACKLDPANEVHKAITKIVESDDVDLYNNRSIKVERPIQDAASTKPKTIIYKGVMKITKFGGQGATELMALDFDFMVSSMEVTAEA